MEQSPAPNQEINGKEKGDDDDSDGVLEHDFDSHQEFEKSVFDPPNVSVTLTWENVSIKAEMVERGCCGKKKKENQEKTTKTILDDVSGIVKPG